MTKQKYIARIDPVSAFTNLQKENMDLNTPVVMLKMIYEKTQPRQNEYVIYAYSRASAWSQARKLARKIAKENMKVHKDHAIPILEIV